MVKRVLIFSTDDHLFPAGGAEQAMGNITERLPNVEFDLICAKLRKGALGYEKVKNVNIHRMGLGMPKVDAIILALFGHFCAYKLLKKYKYDLIWSIMASYGAFAAVRVKKRVQLPFLLTLQEGDSFEYIYERVKYVRSQFDEIFKAADGVQAISNYLLKWGKEMGYAGPHGKVIPNGVDITAFTAPVSEDDIQSIRTAFGFSPDAFILMTSSRLELKNGIGDVIAALPHLPAQVCFVICGSGSLLEEIQNKTKVLKLESRVKFMGFVDPQKLPLIMKASDAFIRPSRSEGLGNAFLEAMAAGLPVLGTDVGGIPDFLQDGKTGIVIRANDPQSIVDGVTRVMALTNEERDALLLRAETLVRDRYDWNRITKDMEALFNTLLS